jgi:2-hydroxy-6-oxonona-2,4-dienedioate hydrolase
LALPVYTHASLRGALFLPDFDEDAFPPLAATPAPVRALRTSLRRVVEDRRDDDALLATRIVNGVRAARLGSGPPVVLLHGYPETLQVWSRVAPRLARHREVIAFDWPGLGYSSPVEGAADPDALADQLRAILDVLGISRADIVGADMGAPPALVFAARHPERVGTVVVMSSLLFGDEPTSIEIRIMRRAGLASAAFSLAPSVVYARCKQSFFPLGESLTPSIDADFARAFGRPEVRARLARMCEDYEHALPSLPRAYWKIRRPVRLLWAEDDGHFPPSHAERLCAILPEARSIVLRDARHWMALSRAEEVAARIDSFLAEARA